MNRFKRDEVRKKLLEKWVAPEQNGTINVDKEVMMEWKNVCKDMDFAEYV
jgi:hypothetical protein